MSTIFLADQRNGSQVDLETTFQASGTATLQCSSLSYSTSLHLIVTPQSSGWGWSLQATCCREG